MFLLLLPMILSSGIAHECGISNPSEEQTNEGIAPLGKWPWQVYVRTPDSFCGGTVIANRWILTAAHCFNDHLKGETFEHQPLIRAGVVNIEESAKDDFQAKNVYGVSRVYLHAAYNNVTFEDDIALLELERPIQYSPTIGPICLANADQDVNIDQQGWIIGFGSYIDDETHKLVDDVSNLLRESPIPLTRHSNCKTEWENVDKAICAGTEGVGAGEGDSGGPLMLQSVVGPWYQVGVVSFGKDDSEIAEKHTIGGYTSVGHYCEWIDKTTKGDAKCAEKEVDMILLKEEEREAIDHAEKVAETVNDSIDDDEKTEEEDKGEEDEDEEEKDTEKPEANDVGTKSLLFSVLSYALH